jgi:hypothetical protein
MRIEEALNQVRAIQLQVARAGDCCCYRWATVAASGWFALAAAIAQARWLPTPTDQLQQYVLLWVLVAGLSVAVIGAEIMLRWFGTESDHARRRTLSAVRQFAPCVATGALMTVGIVLFRPEHAALFPAVWSMLFALGIFASSNYLPAGSVAVGSYYVVAGLVCLRWGQADQALKPWTMVITFVVGQWLSAMALYRHQGTEDGRA